MGALTTLPQAVACGLIAVSPLGAGWSVFGIMASIGSAIVFGLLTAAFDSNPFLISGPRAVTALVFAVGIQAGLDRGLDPETALFLSFSGVMVSGIFQMVSGFLQLGHVVMYLPLSVLAGSMSASAHLKKRARSLLEREAEFLILDMRRLASIDSTGSAAILNLMHMCRKIGGRLVLSCVEKERRKRRMLPDLPAPTVKFATAKPFGINFMTNL